MAAQLQFAFRGKAATSFAVRSRLGTSYRLHIVPWQALVEKRSDGHEQHLLMVVVETTAAQAAPALPQICVEASLTQAECEVLRLIAKGHSAKTIARMREASPNTVRSQIARILHKTKCHSQLELMARLGKG